MAKHNPLVPGAGTDEAVVAQQIEKIDGEVAFDAYVKAQVSAPEVVKRIIDLENCLQRLEHF